MNSSLTSILTAASKEAQAILGEIFTLSGASYKGVVEEDHAMLVPTTNGYEPQRGIRIVATIAQFSAAPDASTRPRIVARSTNWNLIGVATGPLQYTLTAVLA